MALREIAMQIKESYKPSKKDIKRFMQTSIQQMQEVSNAAHPFSPLVYDDDNVLISEGHGKLAKMLYS
eukprot:3224324-Rhodomonas_salina.1